MEVQSQTANLKASVPKKVHALRFPNPTAASAQANGAAGQSRLGAIAALPAVIIPSLRSFPRPGKARFPVLTSVCRAELLRNIYAREDFKIDSVGGAAGRC